MTVAVGGKFNHCSPDLILDWLERNHQNFGGVVNALWYMQWQIIFHMHRNLCQDSELGAKLCVTLKYNAQKKLGKNSLLKGKGSSMQENPQKWLQTQKTFSREN